MPQTCLKNLWTNLHIVILVILIPRNVIIKAIHFGPVRTPDSRLDHLLLSNTSMNKITILDLFLRKDIADCLTVERGRLLYHYNLDIN